MKLVKHWNRYPGRLSDFHPYRFSVLDWTRM